MKTLFFYLFLSLCVLFCFRCKFFSLTETPENYTVVLDEEGFKGRTPGALVIFPLEVIFFISVVISSPRESFLRVQDQVRSYRITTK